MPTPIQASVPIHRADDDLFLRVHLLSGDFGPLKFDAALNADAKYVIINLSGDDFASRQYHFCITDIIEHLLRAVIAEPASDTNSDSPSDL